LPVLWRGSRFFRQRGVASLLCQNGTLLRP
jgi:hypothetical protein